MPARWNADELRGSLNALLPADIWIESVLTASPDFHPRYDAIRRTYRYEVGLRPQSASPFHRRWCWVLDDSLDRDLLDRSAQVIIGSHHFEAFAKAGQPERGYACRVEAASWEETALGVRFTITADRYLHHMVRYLVGTMVDVARARRPLDDVARLLGSEPDVVTSPPAPATGLFLHRVEYPGDQDGEIGSAGPSHLAEHVISRSSATA
jgi:tRNA pseudouridine38-40 synthase